MLDNDLVKYGYLKASDIANATQIPRQTVYHYRDGASLGGGENLKRIVACSLGYLLRGIKTEGNRMVLLKDQWIEVNARINALSASERLDEPTRTVELDHGGGTADFKTGTALNCMITYSKLLFLRDCQINEPVYTRFIARLNQAVPVYDEFAIVRTLFFKTTPSPFSVFGRRPSLDQVAKIVTNLQPIYPPRYKSRIKDLNWDGIPNVTEHFEGKPEQLWQGAFTLINGFQRGNQFARLIPPNTCDRAILALDLTSLDLYWNKALFTDSPVGYCKRTAHDTELRMHVEETSNGVFIIDTSRECEEAAGWSPPEHSLEDGDNLEIHFSINWDAVAAASPRKRARRSVRRVAET